MLTAEGSSLRGLLHRHNLFNVPIKCIWVVYRIILSITVAARSKEWAAFSRSNPGFMGSNPTPGLDVCVRLFYVCVVPSVDRGLTTDWSPVHGVLQTVYKKQKKNLRGLSPQANYTDRATAAVGEVVPTFADFCG
jgi:hypothetical protein